MLRNIVAIALGTLVCVGCAGTEESLTGRWSTGSGAMDLSEGRDGSATLAYIGYIGGPATQEFKVTVAGNNDGTYALRFTATTDPPVTAAIHLVPRGEGWSASCELRSSGKRLSCKDDGTQALAAFCTDWDRK